MTAPASTKKTPNLAENQKFVEESKRGRRLLRGRRRSTPGEGTGGFCSCSGAATPICRRPAIGRVEVRPREREIRGKENAMLAIR
jgi:hypothetical protein